MKNYRDSDYAANKYAEGIVYRFADKTVEVTLEDYLRDNPDKTEADFAELKALSDEMYLEQVRDENRQTYRNVSIHSLDETAACCVPSPEEVLIDLPEQAAQKEHMRQQAYQALKTLTETQRRRFLLYYVDGVKMRDIAASEGVHHPRIVKSIQDAEKKIKNFLANDSKMGGQNASFFALGERLGNLLGATPKN